MRKAGEYFHRFSIERRDSGSDDGYGNLAQSWSALSSYSRMPCKVEMLSSNRSVSEQVAAGRLQSTIVGRISFLSKAVKSKQEIKASDRVVIHSAPYNGLVGNIRQIAKTPDYWSVVLTVEFGAPT